MKRKLIWLGIGLAIALIALPFLPRGGRGQGPTITATWHNNDSDYSITEADLAKNQPFALSPNPLTTPYTDITVTVQTPGWTVTSSVTFVSGPTTVPATALWVEDLTSGGFHAGGGLVNSGITAGTFSFSVHYQLNLDDFGNGSSTGSYFFDITFTVTDGVNNTATATVTLEIGPDNEAVRVDVTASPSDKTITTNDLGNRYFVIDGTTPGEVLQIVVYAMTDYQVTIEKTTTGPSAPGLGPGALLEVGQLTFVDNDDENPASSDLLNDCLDITDQTAACDDIPESPSTMNLFSGGNTEGPVPLGTTPGVTARMGLRLDLDALGDNAAGNAYTFTITFTVTET